MEEDGPEVVQGKGEADWGSQVGQVRLPGGCTLVGWEEACWEPVPQMLEEVDAKPV